MPCTSGQIAGMSCYALKMGRHLMFPIFAHLFDEDGRSLVGATEEQMDALLDTAAEMIPEAVPSIFSFWQSKRAPGRPH